jgi:hypothetical protein
LPRDRDVMSPTRNDHIRCIIDFYGFLRKDFPQDTRTLVEYLSEYNKDHNTDITLNEVERLMVLL